MADIDILNIDSNIYKKFSEEAKKISSYKQKLHDLDKSLENKNLNPRVRDLIMTAKADLCVLLYDLETEKKRKFYMVETTQLIENYRKILDTPVKVSFMGKRSAKSDKNKYRIVKSYVKIAAKYIDLKPDLWPVKERIACPNCPNKKEFDILDNHTYVCTKCYAQQIITKHNSSYNDIDRVNISSKYTYARNIHFRDCINQYQGKQNCTIRQKVYDDLEEQFRLHHLLDGGPEVPKHIRFKRITKNNILEFLRQLGYSKHYENVHLIHYTFTDVQPDDISHLEDKLLNDFDELTDLYDKRYKHIIKRKNFINTQYVLYQLLTRHRHPCKKEEFIILKTTDRKNFHDEVCKTLFEELNWNHTPFY